jgi:hypothetical protein
MVKLDIKYPQAVIVVKRTGINGKVIPHELGISWNGGERLRRITGMW